MRVLRGIERSFHFIDRIRENILPSRRLKLPLELPLML